MRKRITLFICTFLVIYLFDFFIPRLMPGDPLLYTSSVSGEDMDTEYSKEQLDQMRAYYGLDRPLAEQLAQTVRKNLTGDLGLSIHYKKPVTTVLKERLPWSLSVMGVSLILSLVTGTALALFGMQKKRFDRAAFRILSALTEVPAYLVGLLLLFLVAAKVSWLPLSGGATAFARYETGGEKA